MRGPPLAAPRRLESVLRQAREGWRLERVRLTNADLSDRQRTALRAAVRRSCVLWAADRRNRVGLRYPGMAGVLLLAAVCLALPAAVVASTAWSGLAGGQRVLAASIYLAIFGALAAVYFHRYGSSWSARWLTRLGWLGAGVWVVVAVVATALVAEPVRPLGLGVTAGALAAVVILAAHLLIYAVSMFLVNPLLRRSLAAMPPSRAVAVRLWFLYCELVRVDGAGRPAQRRQRMLGAVGYTARRLEASMPVAVWLAGFHGPARYEAAARFRQAARYVWSLGWRILDAADRRQLHAIRDQVARAAAEVATGSWDLLAVVDKQARGRRVVNLARRSVTPAVLAAAALVVPNLPGVTWAGPAATTFQVALLVAAVLSFTPDTRSRERLREVFGDSH